MPGYLWARKWAPWRAKLPDRVSAASTVRVDNPLQDGILAYNNTGITILIESADESVGYACRDS